MTPKKTKSEPLFSVERIENSPFDIVKYREKNEWLLVMSNELLHEPFECKEDLLIYVNEKSYNLILVACAILFNKIKDI